MKSGVDEGFVMMLVGNKCKTTDVYFWFLPKMSWYASEGDLEGKRKVSTEEGKRFAEENKMYFVETSARTAQDVEEVTIHLKLRWATSSFLDY